MAKTVALIPSYQPDAHLIEVLESLSKLGMEEVVVDDGSGMGYRPLFDLAPAGTTLISYVNNCGKGVALEHDGSVYSCDHYVYPEYRLGNIGSPTSLADMAFSARQVQFGYSKSESLPRYCRECAYLSDCWGECPKNRLLRAPEGEPGVNYLCRGLKRFFAHAVPEAKKIAAQLRGEPVGVQAAIVP